MKKIRKFLSVFLLSLLALVYFALSCAIPGLNKDPLTQIPDSWNGRYARDTNLSVAVLEIKEGKIFYITNAWTSTEIFPENCGLEDGKVYYHDEMCQKISGNNIVGYKRNADSNVEYFNNSNKMMYVKIGDSSTTTTTTILALTTTVSGGATTSTTIPQLSYNNSLTATNSEIERGAIINYAAGYIQFVIPRTLAEEAFALDQSVKMLKHHGEYIDVWNWNTARPGITPYIDGYYKIVGSNVYATNQIPLSVFTSNTTGAIFDSWGNPTKYDFGVSICGINGAQLPETINGGYIYNWIAKLSTNTTQWAIATSNFGGSIYVANANFDISLLYSAGTTTTTYPVGTTSTSVVFVTSTTATTYATTSTVYLPTSTTVSSAATTVTSATSTTVVQGTIPLEGLVGEWLFNGDANDSSGNNNHGVVNEATFIEGRFNNGLETTNASTYVNINTIGLVSNGWTQLTLSAWVYINSSTTYGRVIERGGPSFGAFSLCTGIYPSFNVCYSTTDNADSESIAWNSPPSIGSWNHILGVYDGITLKIYKNGILDNTTSVAFENQNRPLAEVTGSETRIGMSPSYIWGDMPHIGLTDNVRIYNRALSDSEIVALYNEESGGSTTTTYVSTTTTVTEASTSTTSFDSTTSTAYASTTTTVTEASTSTTSFDSTTSTAYASTTTTVTEASTSTTSFDSTTSTAYASTTTTTIISNFSTAVDNQNISFITNEGFNWIVDETSYYYGNSSIKNGDINDYSSSYIEATISGVEQISFYWKVSSESNYDYLNFYIDESLITRISGSVDWTLVSYDLDSGTHSIKWSYSKDGSASNGDDCGWIDYINLTDSSSTTTTEPETTTTSFDSTTTTGSVTTTTVAITTTSFIDATTTTVTPIVADPVISYDATNDLVIITCDTPSATIYYTENGGNPSESDYLYEGAFYPTENSVIRAIAYRTDYIPSNVVVKAVTSKRLYIKYVDYIIPELQIEGCSDASVIDGEYLLSPVSGQPDWYYYEFNAVPKNTLLTFTTLHAKDNQVGEAHNFYIPTELPTADAWFNPDIAINYAPPAGAPNAVGNVTVHALKPDSWTNIYIYSWGGIDLTNDNGGWPGELMAEDFITDWYSDTLVDDQNIIFHNGLGNQTIDIPISSEVEIWVNNLIIQWTTVSPY